MSGYVYDTQTKRSEKISICRHGMPLQYECEDCGGVKLERPGDWIQTYTGKRFYILDPRPEDICIEDIAHSLAHQCRYLGHAKHHYSVAQHCVQLVGWGRYARGLGECDLFELLMHDAGEAYYGDWPRPIKNSIPGVGQITRRVDEVIRAKFGLAPEEPEWLKELDLRIVCDEKQALMSECNGWVYIGKEPLGIEILRWTPEMAEGAFLQAFEFLK